MTAIRVRILNASALVGSGVKDVRVEEDKAKGSTAVMFFFTLAETGDTGKLPLITIPAQ
jgi:hypothetical protein